MKSGTFARILLALVVMFFISVTILFLPGTNNDETPSPYLHAQAPSQHYVEQVKAPPPQTRKPEPRAVDVRQSGCCR